MNSIKFAQMNDGSFGENLLRKVACDVDDFSNKSPLSTLGGLKLEEEVKSVCLRGVHGVGV